MSLPQRTLSAPSAKVRGVGLHSGKPIAIRILPADEDAGLAFIRTDLGAKARVTVSSKNVGDTLLATTIGKGDAQVATIEHLLFALCVCGVDNATIEIDGPEVPIMDGSARPFILLLRDTGLVEQKAQKRFLLVKKKVEVELEDEPGRMVSFEPSMASSWKVSISYRNRVISKTAQKLDFDLRDHEKCVSLVAGARTFGFVSEVDFLRSRQRALGGTLDNAVVLDESRILNDGGLRQQDEFIAHKLLDAIGDCYVEGKLVIGAYTGRMPGHKINNLLMRKLLGDKENWEEAKSTNINGKFAPPDFGPLQGRMPPG